MVDPEDGTGSATWTYVGSSFLVVAGSITALYGGTHASSFDWLAGPMLASYALALVALVSGVGLVRGWSIPGARSRRSKLADHSKDLSSRVSESHAKELRAEARDWSQEFRKLVTPDWAVHRLSVEGLDSNESLTMLRRHFPEVNQRFSEWLAMNIALQGVPTTPWGHVSGSGNKPTTPEGEATLKQHNEITRSLATMLAAISARSDLSGQCDKCAGSTPAT